LDVFQILTGGNMQRIEIRWNKMLPSLRLLPRDYLLKDACHVVLILSPALKRDIQLINFSNVICHLAPRQHEHMSLITGLRGRDPPGFCTKYYFKSEIPALLLLL